MCETARSFEVLHSNWVIISSQTMTYSSPGTIWEQPTTTFSPFFFSSVFFYRAEESLKKYQSDGGSILASHWQIQGAKLLMCRGRQSCWRRSGTLGRREVLGCRADERRRRGKEKTITKWGQALTKHSFYSLLLVVLNLKIVVFVGKWINYI